MAGQYLADMKYQFSIFELDTKNQELTANDQVIALSAQNYQLLLFFVQNPGKVFSKDNLIQTVWSGRVVTANSLDQSLSKIRKTLAQFSSDTIIETVYGKGLKLIAEVSVQNADQPAKVKTQTKHLIFKAPLKWALIVAILAVTFWLSSPQSDQDNPIQKPTPLYVISDSLADQSPMSEGVNTLFNQLFQYSDIAQNRDIKQKPGNLSQAEYLENQWKLQPELKIVTTNLVKLESEFILTLTLKQLTSNPIVKSFKHPALNDVLAQAGKWLNQQFNSTDPQEIIQGFLTNDSFALETYLRGLSEIASGNLDKASDLMKLCLQEQPEFHLARLELARIQSKQGLFPESLALLDTLKTLLPQAQIQIELASIRSYIFDTQGKYEKAISTMESLLNTHQNSHPSQLQSTRYTLSYSYTNIGEYDKALEQLLILERQALPTENPELLAHVYQKQGSIYLTTGQAKMALDRAQRALTTLNRLQDRLGQAKVLSLIARILTFQSQYSEAEQYLRQALGIAESLNYQLGIGATLNELIYIQIIQGKLTEAHGHNQEMMNIARSIDYPAMQQISRQHAFEIARAQKRWQEAEFHLQSHQEFAQQSANPRALAKNQMLRLDFLLDQKSIDGVQALLDSIQAFIDKSGENRLQAGLNLQRGRFHIIKNADEPALDLILRSQSEAEKLDDGETLNLVSFTLAEYYLDRNQPKVALDYLKARPGSPSYPGLLLQSKAYLAMGDRTQALEKANQCKQQAHQLWTTEDQRYLSQLQAPDSSS